jgi:hypothetical protein
MDNHKKSALKAACVELLMIKAMCFIPTVVEHSEFSTATAAILMLCVKAAIVDPGEIATYLSMIYANGLDLIVYPLESPLIKVWSDLHPLYLKHLYHRTVFNPAINLNETIVPIESETVVLTCHCPVCSSINNSARVTIHDCISRVPFMAHMFDDAF